jgi:hypothetical protein
MKKIGIVLLIASGLFQSVNAQVREDKIIILESQRSVLRLELNYNSKLVQAAVLEKLGSQSIKAKPSKGFIIAKESKFLDVTPDLLDYYFKVEAVDKKRTALFLGISKGYSNFIDPASNPALWENASRFMESMADYTANLQAKDEAKAMEKDLSSAQKEYDKNVKSLKKQEEALEKSRKELESSQKSLENKKLELDKARSLLKN